jgi:hypothetical protein
MRPLLPCLLPTILFCCGSPVAHASIFCQAHGVVHDPQHRPIAGAQVELQAAHSAFVRTTNTAQDGSFSLLALPLGDYTLTISKPGFASVRQSLTLASETSPLLHFELQVGALEQTVSVSTESGGVNVNTVTPTTLIERHDIAQTPGADRTNSLAMITDFVPGAYMTHDMLHMRGGHQVSWLIDGVQIPNTNIGSNLAAQIDPKDIDYVEIQRGSYTADVGDRTYGVFNVVPRTGFERSREAELVVSAGNFGQTNDQFNFGDHTQRLAYYTSLTGNRASYGLAPPVGRVLHDAANGFGGFASVIYNRTPEDQFRLIAQYRRDFFQIPYDPDPGSFENQQHDSSGLRDAQHESDGVMAASWLHTFSPTTVLQVSPFFHANVVDYDANPTDRPVSSTYHRGSNYAGIQASVTGEIARNTVQAGVYGFGQHDANRLGAAFADASMPGFSTSDSSTGGVVEEYVSDNFKATSWLTLIAGLRLTQFKAQFSEDATAPRFGIALRVPKINWVFRAFYGRFYQPPPLLTADCSGACTVAQYAQSQGTTFAPLHGEHDEEHQFGVAIPFRGWTLDADTFKSRVRNFMDHSNIGESSLYFPVTIDGALIRAWELSLRSPRSWKFGQAHLAYSNQIAEQRGAITGGLICFPASACDANLAYHPVDHDQRNTLNAGFNASLPGRTTASTNVYYGSGFTNGNPDPATPYSRPYLPGHTTWDLAVSKAVGTQVIVSLNAINVTNRRLLLDNSLTFGGFHYNDPRQLYAEVRYKFHF